MPNLGPWELGIVLVIILIIFGAGKLPEVARSLGQGVKEFKKEATDPIGAGTVASSSTTVPAGGSVVVEPAADASVKRELRADEV